MARHARVEMAKVNTALNGVLASATKPLTLEHAVRQVSSQLGISYGSAREKIIVLCEQNPFFAKGFSTDIAGFKNGKKALVSCLQQLTAEGKGFSHKADLYAEVAKRLEASQVVITVRLQNLKKYDAEVAKLLNSLIEAKIAVPYNALVQELEGLVEKGAVFRSRLSLCQHIASRFKIAYSQKLYANLQRFIKQTPALETLVNALVVPPAIRVVNPIDFNFAEKQEYPPQYILGLLENGSLWFHKQKHFARPRPMFTMANSDRKALDIIAGYLETGEVKCIGPGQFRAWFSGFEACAPLRAFLEQNPPVNLAVQFQKWLVLWDDIVSNKGKANCEVWQKVPQITEQPQAQNVVVKGKLSVEWVAGFIDGSIGRFFDARMEHKSLIAKAQLHSVSKQLLDTIRETLGVGTVSALKSNPGKFRYFVNRMDTGLLAEAFDRFPPIIQHERFILWKEVAKLAREDNHPLGDQLVRAEALVAKLNTEGVVRYNK